MISFTGDVPAQVQKTLYAIIEQRNKTSTIWNPEELKEVFAWIHAHPTQVNVIPINYNRIFKHLESDSSSFHAQLKAVFRTAVKTTTGERAAQIVYFLRKENHLEGYLNEALEIADSLNDAEHEQFLVCLQNIFLKQREDFLFLFRASYEQKKLLEMFCTFPEESQFLYDEILLAKEKSLSIYQTIRSHFPSLEKNIEEIWNIVKFHPNESKHILELIQPLFLICKNGKHIAGYLSILIKLLYEDSVALVKLVQKHDLHSDCNSSVLESLCKYPETERDETLTWILSCVTKEKVISFLNLLVNVPKNERKDILETVCKWVDKYHIPECNISILINNLAYKTLKQRFAFTKIVEEYAKLLKKDDNGLHHLVKVFGYYPLQSILKRFDLMLTLVTNPLESNHFQVFHNYFYFWTIQELEELRKLVEPLLPLCNGNAHRFLVMQTIGVLPQSKQADMIQLILKNEAVIKGLITPFIHQITLFPKNQFEEIITLATTYRRSNSSWDILSTFYQIPPNERQWIKDHALPFLKDCTDDQHTCTILNAINQIPTGVREVVLKSALPYLDAKHNSENIIQLLMTLTYLKPHQASEMLPFLKPHLPKVSLKVILTLMKFVLRVPVAERKDFLEKGIKCSEFLFSHFDSAASRLCQLNREQRTQFLLIIEQINRPESEAQLFKLVDIIYRNPLTVNEMFDKYRVIKKLFPNDLANKLFEIYHANPIHIIKEFLEVVTDFAAKCEIDVGFGLFQALFSMREEYFDENLKTLIPFFKGATAEEIRLVVLALKDHSLVDLHSLIGEIKKELKFIQNKRVFFKAAQTFLHLSPSDRLKFMRVIRYYCRYQDEESYDKIFQMFVSWSYEDWIQCAKDSEPILALISPNQVLNRLKFINEARGIRKSQRRDIFEKLLRITTNYKLIKALMHEFARVAKKDRNKFLDAFMELKGTLPTNDIPTQILERLRFLPGDKFEKSVQLYQQLHRGKPFHDGILLNRISGIVNNDVSTIIPIVNAVRERYPKFNQEQLILFFQKHPKQHDKILNLMPILSARSSTSCCSTSILESMDLNEIQELLSLVNQIMPIDMPTEDFDACVQTLALSPREHRPRIVEFTRQIMRSFPSTHATKEKDIISYITTLKLEEIQELIECLPFIVFEGELGKGIQDVLKGLMLCPKGSRQAILEDLYPIMDVLKMKIVAEEFKYILKVLGSLGKKERQQEIDKLIPLLRRGQGQLKMFLQAYFEADLEKRSVIVGIFFRYHRPGTIFFESLAHFVTSLGVLNQRELDIFDHLIEISSSDFLNRCLKYVQVVQAIPHTDNPEQLYVLCRKIAKCCSTSDEFVTILRQLVRIPQRDREEYFDDCLLYIRGNEKGFFEKVLMAQTKVPKTLSESILNMFLEINQQYQPKSPDEIVLFIECAQELLTNHQENLLKRVVAASLFKDLEPLIRYVRSLIKVPEGDLQDVLDWTIEFKAHFNEGLHAIVPGISLVPMNDRPLFFREALCFIKLNNNGSEFVELVRFLQRIPHKEWSWFYQQYLTLYNDTPAKGRLIRFLKTIFRISRDNGEQIVQLIKSHFPTSSRFDYSKLIESLYHIPRDERSSRLMRLIPYHKHLTQEVMMVELFEALGQFGNSELHAEVCEDFYSARSKIEFILLISKFPSHLQERIASMASGLMLKYQDDVILSVLDNLLDIDPQYYDEALKFCLNPAEPLRRSFHLFKENENIRNASYNYLLKLLESHISNRHLMNNASKRILSNHKQNLLHLDHPLVQKAIVIYTLTNPSLVEDKYDPYLFYMKFRDLLSKEPLIDELPGCCLNLPLMREYAKRQEYTIADLPKELPFRDFQVLFEDLNRRIAALPKNKRQEIDQLIMSRYATGIKEIQAGFLKPFISCLFSIAGPSTQKIEATVFYAYSIVKYLCDLPHVISEKTLLTERETNLLHLSLSIQECPTGQRDGIAAVAFGLPVEYRCGGSGLLKLPGPQKVCEVIFLAIQGLMHHVLSDFNLLKQLDPDVPLMQHPHNINFLKNRLHLQIGYKHMLNFDEHVGVINRTLQESSLQVLINAFCLFFNNDLIINALRNEIAKALMSGHLGYMDIIALLEIKKKMRSQDYSLYIIFNDDLRPLGITDLGAKMLLVQSGFGR